MGVKTVQITDRLHFSTFDEAFCQ